MKGMDIDVNKRTLQQLFTTYSNLEVPVFQRPYSWSQDHWSALWEDLTAALQEDYLLGGIVLCGSDDGPELIIDGQQRLTTLTLIAAACRDFAYKLDGEQITETVHSFQHNLIASKVLGKSIASPYITLGETDAQWFQERIQRSPSDPSYNPPELGKVSYKIPSSNRGLWKCYQFFYKKLATHLESEDKASSLEYLAQIYQLLLTRLWLVVTRVPDDSTAYLLFEVLNDRGLDLTIADLIKNSVLSEGKRRGRFNEAKNSWTQISDQLDYSNVSTFLRYEWMSVNGSKITENKLFQILKTQLKSFEHDAFVKRLGKWTKESENYAEIAGLQGSVVSDSKLLEELETLRSYGFKIVYTVLLAIWAVTHDDNHEMRRQSVRVLRVFMMRFALFAGRVTNVLEGTLADIAKHIRESSQIDLDWLARELRHHAPSEEHVRAGFLELDPQPAIARLLLSEIENHHSGDEKKIQGTSDVHVEHIYPKNRDLWPNADFGVETDDEAARFCGMLGNLTLLSGPKNIAASNGPYEEKCAKYCGPDGSRIVITSEIPERWSKWTKVSVQERQSRLYEIGSKIWEISA